MFNYSILIYLNVTAKTLSHIVFSKTIYFLTVLFKWANVRRQREREREGEWKDLSDVEIYGGKGNNLITCGAERTERKGIGKIHKVEEILSELTG